MLRLACSLRLGTISTIQAWSSPTAAAAAIAGCSCLPRLAPAQLPSSAASALPLASTKLDPPAAPAGLHATSNSSAFQPITNLPPSLPSRCLPHLGRHPCSLQSRFTPRAPSRALHGTAVERDPNLSRLEAADVEWFRALLGDGGIVTDPARLEPHNRDWMHKYRGQSQLMLRPRTTKQVSDILAYCNRRRLAVLPQGGNTGLVGGSVPLFDEVILSTQAMTKVIDFNPASGVLVAEAGAVLQTLDEHVATQGWIMPLDLGAKGSCCIGGNVSTNAGGLRLLRYGSLHGTVLGVEAVLADGTVLDLLRTLRKDNTGYDLKQLFIGAEGTLGVVTAVAIQCAPRPASVQSVFLACASFEAVLKVLRTARQMLAEILSAAEFLDTNCMQVVQQHLEGATNPLYSDAPFYMLLETHGSNTAHDVQKLEAFLEEVMASGQVSDGTVAQSQSQTDMMWRVREGISEACGKRGAVYKYDLSVPVEEMYRLVEDVQQRLDQGLPKDDPAFKDVKALGYGHVGDGNLHLNVSVPGGYNPVVEQLLEPFVYEWTTQRRGSVSAEHGIGQMKVGALHFSKSAPAIAVMQQMKRALDPKGILSPYKVLPPSAGEA